MFGSFDVECPSCGTVVKIFVDTSVGVPSEAGAECDSCGAIPIFRVNWEPRIWLEDFKYYERIPQRRKEGVENGSPER